MADMMNMLKTLQVKLWKISIDSCVCDCNDCDCDWNSFCNTLFAFLTMGNGGNNQIRVLFILLEHTTAQSDSSRDAENYNTKISEKDIYDGGPSKTFPENSCI